MKNFFLPILILFFANTLMGQDASIEKVAALFSIADENTDLKTIQKLLEADGRPLRSNDHPKGFLNFYDWKMGSKYTALTIWILNDKNLVFIKKEFSLYDFSKCIALSQAQFDAIEIGITYPALEAMLGMAGDIQTIYMPEPDNKSVLYSWYSCDNHYKSYGIWFKNGKLERKSYHDK